MKIRTSITIPTKHITEQLKVRCQPGIVERSFKKYNKRTTELCGIGPRHRNSRTDGHRDLQHWMTHRMPVIRPGSLPITNCLFKSC